VYKERELRRDVENIVALQVLQGVTNNKNMNDKARMMYEWRNIANETQGYTVKPRVKNKEIEILGIHSNLGKEKEEKFTGSNRDVSDRNKY
jgi:hypothetical protein